MQEKINSTSTDTIHEYESTNNSHPNTNSNSSYYHSFTSSSIDSYSSDISESETETETESSNDISLTTVPTSVKNDYKWKYCIILIIINILIHCLIVIIIIMIVIRSIYVEKKNIVDNDSEYKYEKYQMIYQNNQENRKGIKINEIVELEGVMFEGDYYSFENEYGNGIVVKIDGSVEGEEYEICISECECYQNVECDEENDCGKGMECVENKCVSRRKETVGEIIGEPERKVAQVMITVPLLMCSFGVFTSMYLAKDYGDKYLYEKCKEEACPPSTDEVVINSDTKQMKKKETYYCSAQCGVDGREYYNQVKEKFIENGESEEFLKTFEGKLMYEAELFDNYALNFDKNRKNCESVEIKREIISDDEAKAVQIIVMTASAICKSIPFDWDTTGYKDFVFGQFQGLCKVLQYLAKCELEPLTDNKPKNIEEYDKPDNIL